MSEFFEVTTDYLLKGIEPPASDTQKAPNANMFAIVATAFHALGLVIAVMGWYEKQSALATAIGLVCTVAGVMIYGIGMAMADTATKESAKRLYLSVNAWTVPFIPLSLMYNIFIGCRRPAPYPIPASGIGFALFLACYLAVGTATSWYIRKAGRNR